MAVPIFWNNSPPTPRKVSYWILSWLLMVFLLARVEAQNTPVCTETISEFAELLKDQPHVSPLDIADLSRVNFTVHWIYPDRRAARVFLNRISAYVGNQHVSIKYHWDWPDSLSQAEDQIPIVVFGSENTWPTRFSNIQGYKIVIGSSGNGSPDGLQMPHAGKGMMDLAAQYILNGITLDDQGKLTTGSRVSYLCAEYFGLDEHYLYQKLDSILELGLDSGAYPGAQVSIAYKGSVIYEKAVGYHTYDSIYRVRNHDLFDLASISKVTAGVNSLMFLYEAGKLELNNTLGDYFRYFRNTDKGDLELKRILTHSAGLTPYLVYYNMAQKENGKYRRNTLASTSHGKFNYAVTDSIFVSDRFSEFIYKSIKESPLKSGNKYEYSGLFFLLIPDLVNQLTGSPLDEFLDRSLFDPLGAHQTAFNPVDNYPIHQIVPTEVDQVWRGQLVHGGVHDEASAVLGGISTNAGLFSSGPDLIKIGETWRREGEYGGRRYWSSETIRTFTQCYYCNEGNRRALGFDRPPLPDQDYVSYMSPLASQQSYGHSGFTGTIMWVDPEADYTFVFLSNRVHPTRENSKLYTLNIRPSLHSVLYQAIEKSR